MSLYDSISHDSSLLIFDVPMYFMSPNSNYLRLSTFFQRSVSFKDLTVNLTQKEWQQPEPAQRLRYRDVMPSLSEVPKSKLGPCSVSFCKPDVIFKLKQGEEPRQWRNSQGRTTQGGVRRGTMGTKLKKSQVST